MDFVALDFETANELATSACELGIAVVCNYKVIETHSWLIRPPTLRFNPYNTKLHGIAADDVKDEPTFEELWLELNQYFEDQLLVAHNAAFDMDVMRKLLLHYRVSFQPMPFMCSIKVAKKVWKDEYERYGLGTLSKAMGITLDHHRAESDAVACAEIASKAFREFQISFKEEIEPKLHLMLGSLAEDKLVQPKNKYQQLIKKFPTRKYRRHWK